ncbi:MAG: VOC family protein [Thaumarchaeota archaeon]|nr:VOC family protein [Nitrososphaerota archaeon]
MSLIGQLPLAAIELSCRDLEGSKNFYRNVVGLRPIDDYAETAREEEPRNAHFDLGNIRLTLTSHSHSKGGEGGKAGQAGLTNGSRHFVFVVENAIDAVYADLSKRGVKFKSRKIYEDSSGKAVWFADPDGNVIYVWQPPHRGSKSFKDVEAIVRHYELVSRALADLREGDEEEKKD